MTSVSSFRTHSVKMAPGRSSPGIIIILNRLQYPLYGFSEMMFCDPLKDRRSGSDYRGLHNQQCIPMTVLARDSSAHWPI